MASRGITVNVVAPGLIETDMTRAITEKAQGDWAAQIPLGRLGHAGRCGRGGVLSCVGRGAYITGHVLAVNGGMYM